LKKKTKVISFRQNNKINFNHRDHRSKSSFNKFNNLFLFSGLVNFKFAPKADFNFFGEVKFKLIFGIGDNFFIDLEFFKFIKLPDLSRETFIVIEFVKVRVIDFIIDSVFGVIKVDNKKVSLDKSVAQILFNIFHLNSVGVGVAFRLFNCSNIHIKPLSFLVFFNKVENFKDISIFLFGAYDQRNSIIFIAFENLFNEFRIIVNESEIKQFLLLIFLLQQIYFVSPFQKFLNLFTAQKRIQN
jgi:hypothetical protein